MNENRMQVLQMLAAGQITAEEAERLIAALENGGSAGVPDAGAETTPKARPKYLRVLVEAEELGNAHGPKSLIASSAAKSTRKTPFVNWRH